MPAISHMISYQACMHVYVSRYVLTFRMLCRYACMYTYQSGSICKAYMHVYISWHARMSSRSECHVVWTLCMHVSVSILQAFGCFIYIYICMYVCMYVGMYACPHVQNAMLYERYACMYPYQSCRPWVALYVYIYIYMSCMFCMDIMCICIHSYVPMCICIHMYIYIYIHEGMLYSYILSDSIPQIDSRTFLNTHTHMCVHTHMCMYIQIYSQDK
jgi:hypothetical protein